MKIFYFFIFFFIITLNPHCSVSSKLNSSTIFSIIKNNHLHLIHIYQSNQASFFLFFNSNISFAVFDFSQFQVSSTEIINSISSHKSFNLKIIVLYSQDLLQYSIALLFNSSVINIILLIQVLSNLHIEQSSEI